MPLVHILLCAFVLDDGWAAGAPKELLAVEQARMHRKAYIDWTRRNFEKNRASHYTSKLANDDQIVINRGDDDGVVFRDRMGHPVRGFKGKAHYVLLKDGLRWNSDGRGGTAYLEVATRAHQLSSDVRALGLAPNQIVQQDVHSTLWDFGLERHGQVLYKAERQGELRVVRARVHTPRGTVRETVWWIDVKRDWNPVRVAYLLDGEVRRETRITLARFGASWFPESVARFRWSYKDGKEPYELITVHAATFDEDLPDEFRPEDIAVDAGTSVFSTVPPPRGLFTGPGTGLASWDGERLVSHKELLRRIRAGELEYGPAFRRINRIWRMEAKAEMRAGDGQGTGAVELEGPDRLGLAFVDRTPGLWEEYVNRFIRKYQLGREQVQKAQTILRVCQEQGNNYLHRKREQLKALDTAEQHIKDTADDEAIGVGKLTEILKQRRKMERPLIHIFEDQLVPRLDRLPTRQQRKAAEAANPPPQEGHKP